jgi:hypothetical protein
MINSVPNNEKRTSYPKAFAANPFWPTDNCVSKLVGTLCATLPWDLFLITMY